MWWLRLTRKAPTELEPTDIERLSGGTFAGRVTSLPGQGPRILEANCKSLPESFVNLSGFALQDA